MTAECKHYGIMLDRLLFRKLVVEQTIAELPPAVPAEEYEHLQDVLEEVNEAIARYTRQLELQDRFARALELELELEARTDLRNGASSILRAPFT